MPNAINTDDPASSSRFRWALGSAVAVIILSFVLIRIGVSPALTVFLDNLHWTVAYTAGAWLAWLGYRTAAPVDRAARRWFAWALSAYAVGQVLWDVQVAVGWNPFPGPSDAFYSCLGPGCALGLWSYARTRMNPAQLRTLGLDAGALTVAVLTVVLALYLPRRGDLDALSLLVLLGYPVTLLGGLCLGVVLVLSLQPRVDRRWWVFLVALLVNGALWMRWNSLTMDNALQDGTWFNLCFSLAAVTLGVGAMGWRTDGPSEPGWARFCTAMLRLLPLLLVVIAATSLVIVWTLPIVPVVARYAVGLGVVVVVILAVYRQSMQLSDHDRLREAEQRTLETEGQFRTLFETAHDAIFIMNARLFTDCNTSTLRMFGCTREQIVGHSPVEFSPEFQPDGRRSSDKAPEKIAAAMNGQPQVFEWRHHQRDGTLFDAEVSLNRIEVGGRVLLQAMVRDVSERNRTDRELRESEERYRRIVETAGEGIWMIDAESRTSFVNPRMAEMLGYSVAQMQGRSLMEFIDEESRGTAETNIERRRQGISEQHDFRFVKQDGSFLWGALATSPILDANGTYAGALAMVTDITDRKRTIEALRESEERFRLMIDHSPEAIVLLDLTTGKFSLVNPAAELLFRLPTAELCQRGPIEMSPPLQADGRPSEEKARQYIARAMAGETPVFDWLHRDAQGNDIQCEVSLLRLKINGREVVRGNITEMTRRKEAEKAIRESEAKFHAVFDQSPLAIVLTDVPDCRVIDANAAAEQMLGRTLAEMRGLTSMEMRVWVDPAAHDRYLQLLLRDGAVNGYEAGLRRKDGVECTVVHSGRVVHFGSATYVLNSLLDITERKKVEEELRQNREQFIDLFDNAPVGYHEVDATGRFTRINQTELKMLGYSGEELLGLPAWKITAAEEASQAAVLAKLQGAQPGARRFERQFRRKDGTLFPVLIEDQILRTESGGISGIRSVVQDITERKRAEEKAQHLANFPELNPNPVLEFTAEGALMYHNPAALSMAQLVGFSNLEDLLPPETKAIITKCLVTGQPQLRLETRQGEHTLSWSFYPISAQQVVHCYVGDITKRLQLEEQFRQAQKMEAIGQLSGGVAHDFNNLLTVILGNIGLLQSSGQVSMEVAEPLQAIGHAANRAANLTRQLLAFSRQQVMQQENLDLNAVVGHISKMLRRVIGEAVKIRLDYAMQVLPIHADQGMLEQVILNLCINARDAMPQGGQLILRTAAIDIAENEARLMVAARAGSFAMMIVTDTGTGIAPENMKRVFEPFFTTKEVGKGTGLGLASVYGIAQQHNGWVTVESEVGRGTTFTVYLPLLDSPARPGSERPQIEKLARGTETILLVEDDLAVQTVTKVTLQRLGYQVLVASNGQQALRIWQERQAQIQLVLTDMIMPEGLSGSDIARQFKSDLPGIRIIYMSGYSADIAGTDFSPEEGDYFIGKPFEMHVLAATVRKSLDAVRGR